MKSSIADKVEAETEAKLPALLAKLDAYLAIKGVGWQGLWTHADGLVPDDGKDVSADRLKVKADPAEPNWEEMLSEVAPFTGCALAIDQYGGPGKRGYVVLQRIKDDLGKLWQRALNYGPEKWRAYDWREV